MFFVQIIHQPLIQYHCTISSLWFKSNVLIARYIIAGSDGGPELTPLQAAAKEGNLQQIKNLLGEGANVDEQVNS